MDMPDRIARRELLKTAGLAAAGAAFWPGGLLRGLAADEAKSPPGNAKETLDALLEKYRRHQLSGRHAGGPGAGPHIPMVLVALYRMGGTAEQMHRYVATYTLHPEAEKPTDASGKEKITPENWRNQLEGFPANPLQASLYPPRYVDFFDKWTQEASVETVLKESVSTLLKGPAAMLYHPLLRLGYAIDYGDRKEIVHALADMPGTGRSPDYDAAAAPVEPDVLLAEILKNGPKRGPSTTGRIEDDKDFTRLLKPVRFPDSDPLGKISEIILETFAETQGFGELHWVTSCQALRLILPYASDPRDLVSRYWHTICARYLVDSLSLPRFGKDSVKGSGNLGWKEVLSQAAVPAIDTVNGGEVTTTVYEHRIKLVYTCWLESQHYKRDRYLALVARGWGT